MRGLLALLGAMLLVGGGVSLATLPRHAAEGEPARTKPVEVVAAPSQVAVVDAGTLRLGDRVVRLRGVKPPSRGVPCGANQDCAAAAADALAALVRDAPVSCRLTGLDNLGRPFGDCQANGTDLNQAVIAAGWARTGSD